MKIFAESLCPVERYWCQC